MRAVNGYLENGRFTPLDLIKLPRRVQAVLVYNDVPVDEDQDAQMAVLEEVGRLSDEAEAEERERRIAWLKKLDEAISLSMNEDLPDFMRSAAMRESLNLAD